MMMQKISPAQVTEMRDWERLQPAASLPHATTTAA